MTDLIDTALPPLPEPVGTFYVDENTGRWSQYRNTPAVLTDGDARFFDAEAMRAYGALVRAQALEDAAQLVQANASVCSGVVRDVLESNAAAIRAMSDAPGA